MLDGIAAASARRRDSAAASRHRGVAGPAPIRSAAVVVGVDGRSLTAAGRGVGAYAAGMLAALAAARPGDEWRVSLPAGPAAKLPGNVVAVRHRLPSRALHGAAALTGRPRLDRLLGRPDVVWLPAPAPVAPGRTPYVLTVHDLAWIARPRDLTRYERLWHRAGRLGALARGAAAVAADSRAGAEAARAEWGLAATVVGAGPGDPGPPTTTEAVAAARARHGLPARYLLFVGALEPRKGLAVLVAAYARARAQGLDAALAIAGAGRLRAALGGPGVHLLGRVDGADKAALYAGAIAVVLPSWLEGYGYPPLEGLAHGTPAIVTAVPALLETAGPGARAVPPGDADALAAAMIELAGDPALRARLAAAGAAILADRSWAACAQRMWELLAAAAGGGAGR